MAPLAATVRVSCSYLGNAVMKELSWDHAGYLRLALKGGGTVERWLAKCLGILHGFAMARSSCGSRTIACSPWEKRGSCNWPCFCCDDGEWYGDVASTPCEGVGFVLQPASYIRKTRRGKGAIEWMIESQVER